MSERHRDPLELWVGTWTPEEWIDRENRKRDEPAPATGAPESSGEDPQVKAD